jgi:hypothetical protein
MKNGTFTGDQFALSALAVLGIDPRPSRITGVALDVTGRSNMAELHVTFAITADQLASISEKLGGKRP